MGWLGRAVFQGLGAAGAGAAGAGAGGRGSFPWGGWGLAMCSAGSDGAPFLNKLIND